MSAPESGLTQLLVAWSNGDKAALDQLAPLVEAELRRLARVYLGRESPGHTLQPTALVNEAYLRLIQWRSVEWKDRAHFFAVAAKMMRRILVNHAVGRGRRKRGGSAVLIALDQAPEAGTDRSDDIIALDEALTKLASFDERKSQIVELRFFGGLSEDETAEVLQSSVRTIQREWSLARAWLFRELNP
ncbi:MAG: sigma-70 family RNA polymerase sigma factor [Bryobacteraceae bacterium]|nr:sigma-70 family RNA polymerase sigma factor [Bryobacteraceae bacterium]